MQGFDFRQNLNYRRDDSRWPTLSLYNLLAQVFPREQLFMDVEGYSPTKLRAAYRYSMAAVSRGNAVGFRLARTRAHRGSDRYQIAGLL